MKRRQPDLDQDPTPTELARFVLDDWIDPTEPPPRWALDELPLWFHIRAFRRFSNARIAFDAQKAH